MVVTCDIEFENNSEAIYYVGQVIVGKVTLTADRLKQVKAVKLKISGSAKTKWKEKHSDNDAHESYHSQVDYLKTVTSLLAPKADDQAVTIEPGIHTFSFVCHIPLNCPSSFEEENGCIRYFVQVSLERPWKFDQHFTKGLTILAIMNLNYDDLQLQLPVKTDITKHFCCGPCLSDPLEIKVELPQTGYVPGQLIPINILVTNNTMSRINEIIARLVMIVEYFSSNPKKSKRQTKTISKVIGDAVLNNCKTNYNYLLPVPATPPTCMTLCSIIQISYRIEVEAKMRGIFYRDQSIHTPVTIGNVPLQMESRVMQQQPAPKQLNLENTNQPACVVGNSYDTSISSENKDPWSAISNIPAPVYMEATHMPKAKLVEDGAHEYGEKQFTPKYPVFDMPSPASPLSKNSDAEDGHTAPTVAADPDKTTWL